MTPKKQYLISAEDDGLPALDVHSWAEDKYIRSTMYAEMFSTGMKNRAEQRVYVGVCTGPGHVAIRESGARVLGAPLLVIGHVLDPFDRYVFCDKNDEYLDALRQRVDKDYPNVDVRYVPGDANQKAGEILSHLPEDPSNTLVFAFVDPFQLNVGFELLEPLANYGRVDILLTLMLHHDANRAWSHYVGENNQKIDRLLGDTSWRERWDAAVPSNPHPVAFLSAEVARRMTGLGYLETPPDRMFVVRTDRNTPLYHLAFFSRSRKGHQFWSEVLKYSSDQREFPLM